MKVKWWSFVISWLSKSGKDLQKSASLKIYISPKLIRWYFLYFWIHLQIKNNEKIFSVINVPIRNKWTIKNPKVIKSSILFVISLIFKRNIFRTPCILNFLPFFRCWWVTILIEQLLKKMKSTISQSFWQTLTVNTQALLVRRALVLMEKSLQ